MKILLLVLGLVLLIKGAGYLVSGASSLARRLGISPLVIGLTIVAFGTSAPELIVNIVASIQGNTDIAIGNILGSNIANILLILGIAACIAPITVKKGTVWKEIPLSLLAALLVGIMANDALIDGESFSSLTRSDGYVLLAFFIVFLYYTFGISKVEPSNGAEEVTQHSIAKDIIMIAGGLVGLTVGGSWVVGGATYIASALGVSEAVIGLTVVAIGTSLPELVTSAVAAYRGQSDIAVGNVVGSNIFNIFWILGVSAIINPLPFSEVLMRDVLMTILATALLFGFMFVWKRHTLERKEGIGFIIVYCAYIALLVYQETL